MFNTFFTPTAESIPVSEGILGSFNVLEALKKLAFLSQISNIVSQNGDIVIKIGASPVDVILSSPVGRWRLLATEEGQLYTRLLNPNEDGAVTYWQFPRSNGSYVAIEVDEFGSIIMVNPPTAPGFDISKIYIQGDNGSLFSLGVTDENEFYTEIASTSSSAFKIINQQDDVLFSVAQSQNYGGLGYMYVYELENLPSSPRNIGNTLPWVFLKNGESSQPIFYDGSAWRYFRTGELVAQ